MTKRFLTFFLILFAVSCTGIKGTLETESTPYESDGTKSDVCVNRVKLRNPYTLRNMQQAADSICSLNSLQHFSLLPTHIYVRIMPTDSIECNRMLALNCEFFDFPLDEYSDGHIEKPAREQADSSMTWKYCVLPITNRALLFENLEVLDTCYIPSNDDIAPMYCMQDLGNEDGDFYISNSEIERLAFQLANPDYSALQSRARYALENPSGCVTMTSDSVSFPLKGVNVKSWSFVKIRNVNTDTTGHYEMKVKFLNQPHFMLRFDNDKPFKIYDAMLDCTPVNKVYEDVTDNIFNINIERSDPVLWYSSVVNNAAYDYYTGVSQTNGILPPDNLRIIVKGGTSNYWGGAPMLRHLTDNTLASFFLSDVCTFFLRYFLPDVIIRGSSQTSYNSIYSTTIHELTHASHFNLAGVSNWLNIMTETIYCSFTKAPYGYGLHNGAAQDFLELAESWAYANESHERGTLIHPSDTNWFNNCIDALYSLLSNNVLSSSQIANCLTPDVVNMDDLCNKLCYTYPDNVFEIVTKFCEYNTLHYQTVWKVYNATTHRINVTTWKGNNWRSSSADVGDTAILMYIPNEVENFNHTKYDFPEYYPDRTVIRSNAEIVYKDYYGEVFPRLTRPFFYMWEWSDSTETVQAGNKNKITYLYTLTDSDIF